MAYAFRLRQGPRTLVRVSFNDLPVMRQPSRDGKDDLRPASHLLVPGKNTMRLEVWEGPPSEDSPSIQGIVDLALYEIESEQCLAQILWPQAAIERGLAESERMPFRHEVELEIPATHPPPVYAEAAREEVPPNGTPGQREAVQRLHEALVREDASAFLSENRLKLAENRRYYGATPGNDDEAIRRSYAARFARRLAVEPLDDKVMRFEPRADSRACYVTRTDGKPVLHAAIVGEPALSFSSDPVFVKNEGVWTLLL